MTFTIDRATWANASTTDQSRMFDSANGMMCCLGQICKQTGTPRKHLIDQIDPADVGDNIRSARVQTLLLEEDGSCSTLAVSAMNMNDNPALTKRERECKLKALFLKAGHKLNFVGRSPRHRA
jgi:3-methyladenine DNA glycosylase Mpg